MSNKFILSCESTVDLPYSYVAGRDISVLFYSYSIDGVEFEDEMGKELNKNAADAAMCRRHFYGPTNLERDRRQENV